MNVLGLCACSYWFDVLRKKSVMHNCCIGRAATIKFWSCVTSSNASCPLSVLPSSQSHTALSAFVASAARVGWHSQPSSLITLSSSASSSSPFCPAEEPSPACTEWTIAASVSASLTVSSLCWTPTIPDVSHLSLHSVWHVRLWLSAQDTRLDESHSSTTSLLLGTPVAVGVADWRRVGKEAAMGTVCNESCLICADASLYCCCIVRYLVGVVFQQQYLCFNMASNFSLQSSTAAYVWNSGNFNVAEFEIISAKTH